MNNSLIFVYFVETALCLFLLSKVILPKLGVADPRNRFSIMLTYFLATTIIWIVALTRNGVLGTILFFLTWPTEYFITQYMANHCKWIDEEDGEGGVEISSI